MDRSLKQAAGSSIAASPAGAIKGSVGSCEIGHAEQLRGDHGEGQFEGQMALASARLSRYELV